MENTFEKIIRIGTQKECNSRGVEIDADIFCKIEYRAKKDPEKFELSISGVIAPLSNGNCLGSCGQINMGLNVDEITPAPNWDKDKIEQLLKVWDEWHLNDMNAATRDMKDAGWLELAKKNIYKWSLIRTDEAQKEYEALKAEIVNNAVNDDNHPLDEKNSPEFKTEKEARDYMEKIK